MYESQLDPHTLTIWCQLMCVCVYDASSDLLADSFEVVLYQHLEGFLLGVGGVIGLELLGSL